MNDKVYFNFSYLALKLLGSGMYSNPWNAISELVANGFDAGATDVFVHINMVDKEHSSVEIFDNGTGMSYNDLVNKYAFIGRNKRLDCDYNSKAMGRKGIGKLATLYLSNNVYIISKNNHLITAWNLNLFNISDDERPSLNGVDPGSIKIHCNKQWSEIESGLLLRLNDVNLTGLGEKTMEGLVNRLSNFYLLDSDNRRVWISCSSDAESEPTFVKVHKNIADRNFYALFNNSDVIFQGFENRRVWIKTPFKELEEGYPTVLINHTEFKTSGRQQFMSNEGVLIEKDYSLVGWIGIHTSINVDEARRNDKRFIKNTANTPNKLRLYIRGKLAVENFLDYIKNTQAFANYIEGEISFDVLDDDDLPDITTANRQQVTEKDERVQLLIELLKPIITKLIRLRVGLSALLKDDEERIRNNRIEDLNIKHKKEKKELEDKLYYTNQELESRREQVRILSKGLHKNAIRLAEAIHTINKTSITIKSIINRVYDKYRTEDKTNKKIIQEVAKVDISNSKILLLTKYATNATFELKSKIITVDIGLFIKQYFDVFADANMGFAFEYSYDENSQFLFSFDSTVLGIILDNILSNSLKANSNRLLTSIELVNDQAIISFADNGEGYNHETFTDPSVFFELGFRSSREKGQGIGLYHIKQLIDKNGGRVFIDSEYMDGFKITIVLNKM